MALSLFTAPEFGRMEKALDRAFDRAFGTFFPLAPSSSFTHPGTLVTTAFPCDITEQQDKYLVVADAPGLTDKDLKIELHDNVLVVSGQRSAHHEARTPEGKVWRQERSASKFSRSFSLPEDAVKEGITARLEHGALTLTVPKSAPPAKPEPRSIPVQLIHDNTGPAQAA